MVLVSLYSSIPLLLVKELIEALSLLKDLWMQAHLPHDYTDVPPVTISIKHSTAPATRLTSLDRENFKKQTVEEYLWLGNAKKVLMDNTLTPDNASWAAFHASRQSQEGRVIWPTALLLLFLGSAHTVAMIRHSIDVVTKAENHLNSGQISVVTFDQPCLP